MSAVSLNSFLAPLSNRMHLTTIVLVAAAFGFFRWSGGGLEVRDRRSPHASSAEAPSAPLPPKSSRKPIHLDDDDFQDPRALSPSAELDDLGVPNNGRGASALRGRDDLADELLAPKAQKAPPPTAVQKNDSGKLEDIEKMLGLK